MNSESLLTEAVLLLREAAEANRKLAARADENASAKLPSAELRREVDARRMELAWAWIALAAAERGVPGVLAYRPAPGEGAVP